MCNCCSQTWLLIWKLNTNHSSPGLRALPTISLVRTSINEKCIHFCELKFYHVQNESLFTSAVTQICVLITDSHMYHLFGIYVKILSHSSHNLTFVLSCHFLPLFPSFLFSNKFVSSLLVTHSDNLCVFLIF